MSLTKGFVLNVYNPAAHFRTYRVLDSVDLSIPGN